MARSSGSATAGTIVNFFAVTDRKLRFLFNFDLAMIDRVDIGKPRGDEKARARGVVRVDITTPSGHTVRLTTRELASALARGVARRRSKRR